MRRSLVGASLALVAAGPLLGACASAPAKASPAVSSPAGAAETPLGASSTIPAGLAANARADVTAASPCHPDAAGTWMWSGTVTNRSSALHSYRIIVDFTDSTATVEQTKIVTVAGLDPGRTAGWSVGGAPGMANIRCVIRSARFS
jgi:hypothetical protein